MNLVCLDTHYFTWAILEKSNPLQTEMIPKAKAFFRKLDEIKAIIVVPTPIITELLMESEPSERDKVLKVLHEWCHVVEFHALAAKNAADIWNAKKKSGVIEELKKSGASMRTKIKVDTLILGVAMAANVSTLYTEDGDFKKMADGYLVVASMPEIQEQSDLPNFTLPIASGQPSSLSLTAAQE